MPCLSIFLRLRLPLLREKISVHPVRVCYCRPPGKAANKYRAAPSPRNTAFSGKNGRLRSGQGVDGLRCAGGDNGLCVGDRVRRFFDRYFCRRRRAPRRKNPQRRVFHGLGRMGGFGDFNCHSLCLGVRRLPDCRLSLPTRRRQPYVRAVARPLSPRAYSRLIYIRP